MFSTFDIVLILWSRGLKLELTGWSFFHIPSRLMYSFVHWKKLHTCGTHALDWFEAISRKWEIYVHEYRKGKGNYRKRKKNIGKGHHLDPDYDNTMINYLAVN